MLGIYWLDLKTIVWNFKIIDPNLFIDRCDFPPEGIDGTRPFFFNKFGIEFIILVCLGPIPDTPKLVARLLNRCLDLAQ